MKTAVRRLTAAILILLLLLSGCAGTPVSPLPSNGQDSTPISSPGQEETPSGGQENSASDGQENFTSDGQEKPSSDGNEKPPEKPFPQPNIQARHALVYDLTEKRILFCKDTEDERVYPASVTKLYTILTALHYLDPDEIITAGNELNLVRSGSSRAYIRKGQKLTVSMLIEGMLLPSGNDAAYVLSVAAGRRIAGSPVLPPKEAVSRFVWEMNRQAEADGLVQTHFVTPDGWHDDDHYTSLRDLISIAEQALAEPEITKYTSLASAKVTYASGETNRWKNTNELLKESSPFYRKGILGLKTGHTNEAGFCLLTAATAGDSTVLIAVFGAETSDMRFEDSVKLLDVYRKWKKE